MYLVALLLFGSLLLGIFSKQLGKKTYIVLGLMILFAIIGYLYMPDTFL